MKTFAATLILAFTLPSLALEARYFRAWQGFKKTTLTAPQFVDSIPAFMQETVNLYDVTHGILSNYLVVMPPLHKPAYVPDELALVALASRETYQQVRATEAGAVYSARHWDVFEKGISASADPMVDFSATLPSSLEHNKSYDVLCTPIDWSQGHTMVYIGLRKTSLAPAAFLQGLAQHLSLVKRAFSARGLNGYIVIANQDYEVAYMNWDSAEAMQAANRSPEGRAVSRDAHNLLNHLMLEAARPLQAGLPVTYGAAYSTL